MSEREGRNGLARLLARPRYELIPLTGAEAQAALIPPGTTVTVTSSPRRGMEPTLALCERLAGSGLSAVPHLSSRLIEGRKHLEMMVARLDAAGIREVFVVGGDPPVPAGPYPSALSLLRGMADTGHRFERVGVAGYPERHPLIESAELLQALRDKQPFATYVVTQMCYSPKAIADWIDRIRADGVALPIHVGMPGLVPRAKLLEISIRCGVGDSVRYLRKNSGIVARLLGAGARSGYRAGAFVAELAALLEARGEALPLHLNTFNQVAATERWRLEFLGEHSTGAAPGETAERTVP